WLLVCRKWATSNSSSFFLRFIEGGRIILFNKKRPFIKTTLMTKQPKANSLINQLVLLMFCFFYQLHQK
ncbi:hypothetical protein B4900_15555, partial [Yersinia rohdei]